MVLNLLSGIILLLLMVLASGVVVDVFEKFAFRLPVKKQTLAAMLVGFALALPELFVGIASAVDGKPQIALGNIVGANMANLSLIVGGVAIAASVVPIVGEYLQKDLWITIGLALLPFMMLMNGVISKFEGIILIGLYFVYAFFLFSGKGTYKQARKKIGKHESWASIIVLVLGLIILSASAWLLVQVGVKIAEIWQVSWYWVGLIIFGFGTTLPELFLLLTQKKHGATLILPKLLGSVVMNSTLVIGIVALIQPVILDESFQRGLSSIFLVAILGLFWLFTKSKKKLERWEGVVLVGVYLMFIGLQMIFAS
jgi:cation:H+ antiporter